MIILWKTDNGQLSVTSLSDDSLSLMNKANQFASLLDSEQDKKNDLESFNDLAASFKEKIQTLEQDLKNTIKDEDGNSVNTDSIVKDLEENKSKLDDAILKIKELEKDIENIEFCKKTKKEIGLTIDDHAKILLEKNSIPENWTLLKCGEVDLPSEPQETWEWSKGKIIVNKDKLSALNQVKTVTMRQARLALLKFNKLDMVQSAIDSLDEPMKSEAKIEWEYSAEVNRDKPFVIEMCKKMGLSDSQVNDLFNLAKTL